MITEERYEIIYHVLSEIERYNQKSNKDLISPRANVFEDHSNRKGFKKKETFLSNKENIFKSSNAKSSAFIVEKLKKFKVDEIKNLNK